MIDKEGRQQRIREILARNEIHSQGQLQALLAAERIPTTQATLSRDLRDIGASRGAKGYAVHSGRALPGLESKDLERSLRGVVIDAKRGGTLVVIRTEPGHAAAVARHIEAARSPLVLGAAADHGTVLVATGSAGEAKEVLRLVRRVAKI